MAAVTNAARSTGQVGIGISGWQTQEFADLRITPVGGSGTATTLVNAATGRCLDVPGGNTTDGTQLIVWDCRGDGNQLFTAAGGTLQALGKCLDASGGTTPGTRVVLWTCNGGAGQQWTHNADGTVTGKQSGLCLDLAGDGTGNGTPVDLWTCQGAADQKWTAD